MIATGTAAAASKHYSFKMIQSSGALGAGCLSGAGAAVSIRSLGPVEVMKVVVSGLPANTDFDLFVIQLPNAPFGIGWYQGDIQTDSSGTAEQTFIGRFSIETFAVAPGSGPAPQVFNGPFPDASVNPPFNPIQMYHLGLWFNSPADAQKAGCPGTVTPFNGTHNAGIQALSTRNFSTLAGPLINVQ
jgi:hypothetical protein